MTNALFFFIAAICVFVIAAFLAFAVHTVSVTEVLGVIAVGLACFVVGHVIP